MAIVLEYEFAQSASAEVPAVIAYTVALIIFAFAWSSFSLPTVNAAEARSAAVAKITQNHQMLIQHEHAKSKRCC
jgi:hypothetical protein